jgi:Arc/MetJ-type ribon-helix-helix transcriptional regulator
MSGARSASVSLNLGAAEAVGLRLVQEGRFEDLSDACRAGLRRFAEDSRVIDRLVLLGEEGMSSGIDHDFDIDQFIDGIGSAQ